MQFSHDRYKEMLYAVAEYYDESIINMDVIQPEASYCNTDLRDKLIAMHLPKTDHALKHVRLSEISSIWDLLEVVEDDYCQKEALDILADFADAYQDEFGRDSMNCVSNYLACEDIDEIELRKLVKQYMENA